MATSRLGKISVFLVLTLILVIWLITRAGDAATEIAESMSAIEASQAAESAADAAQVASRGLSTVSTIQAMILFFIVTAVIALVGLVIYLLLERRVRNAQFVALLDGRQNRQWAPGPNAGWKKLGDGQPSIQSHQPQVSMQDAMAMAVVGLVAGVMQQLQNPHAQQPTYPVNRAYQQAPFAETGEADATDMLDYGVPAKQLTAQSDWDMFNE